MTSYAIKSGSMEHRENTRRAIRERTPFRTGGSLRGVAGNPGGVARLNNLECARYFNDADRIDYVVLSYSTPIAWHTAAGWHVVEQKFSVTTTNQQSAVRAALRDEVTR